MADIKASSLEEAIAIANRMYDSEEIVLDYDDLCQKQIITTPHYSQG